MSKMARMHSRNKGKSGSKRPLSEKSKVWVKYTNEEVSKIIDKLHKSGKTPSQIGIILRDNYGVPNIRMILKKKLVQDIASRGVKLEIPEDLKSLMKKEITLNKHFEKNKHDMTSKRGLQLTESKIRRLVKYYKRTKVLPADWVYDKDKVKLLIS